MQPQVRSNIVQLPIPMKQVALRPPSIHEVHMHAIKIDLPDTEAEKFFHHYTANGWMAGKVKMQNWHSAMAGWRLRWQEREARFKKRSVEVSPNVQLIQWRHELERVEAEMKRVKGASWTQNDGWDDEGSKSRHRELRLRRDELLKKLGMSV